jgi:peptidoglycan/LPS O-acetylase OafA/YrhL
MSSTLSFRPDLQGLRAIAVLGVLIFHVWPKIFRGGFVGVDVFFVISGYLITSLILGEIEQHGRLDLMRFWGRRMLRLLPAATLVLLVALIGTLIWLPRTEWINTARHALAAALYAENWALVAQAVDYWAQGQSPSPVQHFWSLSIEEQFYFVWPPLLAIAGFFGRLGRQSVRVYAGILMGLIFGISLYFSIVPQPWAGTAYFTTATRAWELALGALIAVTAQRIHVSEGLRSALSWVGLIAICGSIALINETMRFPGWVALIPTLGTALVIMGGKARFSPFYLLALRPMQYVGDISYALYLWHWPIIIFLKPVGDVFTKGYAPYLVIGATFVLAILTKYLVEDPFRTGKFSFRREGFTRSQFIIGAYFTALALIMISGVSAGAMWVFEERSQVLLEEENEKSYDKDPRYPGAAAFDKKKPAPVPEGVPPKPNPRIAERDTRWRFFECMNRGRVCEFGNPQSKTTVALVGDSHSMSYGPAMEIIANRQGWKLLMMVKVACPIGEFSFSTDGKYRADCDGWRARMVKWVAEAKPDYVVSTGGREGVYGGFPSRERQVEGYRTTWKKFLSHDSRVIVIHDNPVMLNALHGGWFEIPKCLTWYPKNPKVCFKSREITLDSLADTMVMAAEGTAGVGTINLTDYMCTKDECPAIIGNVVVYRDAHHLTETFVKTLVPYLEKDLLKVMASLPSTQKKVK